MAWKVTLHRKAEKQTRNMPKAALAALFELMNSIRQFGPMRGDWPNYGKLSENKHHCHLKKGNPTYVAVWIEDKQHVTVEVIYAGTHEKAPY